MQIDLPQDIVERVQLRAAGKQGVSEADVIRQALDSLDWQEQERASIQEGIDAWQAGKVRRWAEFDAEFRAKNNIGSDN
jgi:predicted transcriptional regulator